MRKIARECQFCKKDFFLNPRLGERWAKKTNRGIFCSRECYYKYRKGIRVSPKTEFSSVRTGWNNHPRFKTGIWSYSKFRKKQCQICGEEKYLLIHHQDKNRNNNELNNLLTVCAKCHTNIFHPRRYYGNQFQYI